MPAVNRTCLFGQFQCTDGRCIFPRYQCDNFKDCRDGSDETVELCGEDPCRDRIRCGPNDRCIPISWCCHRPASAPTGPYDCDPWQRQICCSRPAVSNPSLDQDPFIRGNLGDDQSMIGSGFTDSKRSAFASSSTGNDAIWGFQSAVFVVAGCTLAFVALILLASYLGAKYLVRKLHHHQVPLENEEHGDSHCRTDNRSHSCRSHSTPRHVSIAGVGPLVHSRSSSLDNNQVLRVYFINGRHHHRRTGTGGHCGEPTCSLLMQYPFEPDAVAESPPPPYSDLGAGSEPPPEYASLPAQSNESFDDGLPGYLSAVQSSRRDTVGSTEE